MWKVIYICIILSSLFIGAYTYNYQDKVMNRTDPGGHTYSYEYDSQGRPIRIINPDSTFKEIYYDDITNTTTILDENQHKREFHYNWNGNLLWVEEYTNPVNYYLTQYTYDSRGNLTSFTDANGNTTLYSYDSLFGITQVLYPDLTTETYSYDAAGNVIQRTDSNGSALFTYDDIYRLIEIVHSDSVSTFQYDANGNVTLMTDPAGSTGCNYDNRNRCLSETRITNGQSYAVSYTHDAASRVISTTYPDQSVITYEYDALNRLVSVPGYAEFTYNSDSLLASMTYSNGTVTEYEYDSRNRPVTIHAEKNDPLLTVGYQYDPVGNVTQLEYGREQGQEWVESSEVFAYDWLDRLVSAQGDYGVLTYVY